MFRATYRLQLQKNFQFKDATKITEYLADLGVSHLYLSPILESLPGSNHGYDVTDLKKISEERGGETGFDRLARAVHRKKCLEGLILDIVPNHVAASWRTPAWWDVLEKGPVSEFWRSFDIRELEGGDRRVLVPILGRSRSACVASRELQFDFVEEKGIVIRYWNQLFPVQHSSYHFILEALAHQLVLLNPSSQKARLWQKKLLSFQMSRERLLRWLKTDAVFARGFILSLKALPLKVLEITLENQNYLLEDWRTGSRRVNYRRFFDINDLAALRVEDDFTFKWSHSKLRYLMKKYPLIHGLRVDHIDGLTDPEAYLSRLAKLNTNVWVEKILGDGESLPKNWPVIGTTGYDFLNLSARLFVDLPGLLHLQSHYTRHVDQRWERFHDCLYASKKEILETHFVSELDWITKELFQLFSVGTRKKKMALDFSEFELKEALIELSSSLKVYRTYFTPSSGTNELRWLSEAFHESEGRGRLKRKKAFYRLRKLLLEDYRLWSTETYRVVKRWEQLTGPVMAKGLEDTALYRYFPLLSLNVVGGEPGWVGDGAVEFHAFNGDRTRLHKLSMSTTSTHDTKRSEDVRSRIHVISEVSEEWTAKFKEWHDWNRYVDRDVPDLAMEYLIYETLIGAWPHGGRIESDFPTRLKNYFLKAAREAKSETSWIEPNHSYEQKLMDFVDRVVLTIAAKKGLPKGSGRAHFQKSFLEFARRCSYFGAFNSLSLITLKALSPGLPDFYQGCEDWNLSLVDPDNRRPVDFPSLNSRLKELRRSFRTDASMALSSLLENWESGDIKLWLTSELLHLRSRYPELFLRGEYIALEPEGDGKRNFVCYLRRHDELWALVAVPRLLAHKTQVARDLRISEESILSTEFVLPEGVPLRWRHPWRELSKSAGFLSLENGSLKASDVLSGIPVGVLIGEGP